MTVVSVETESFYSVFGENGNYGGHISSLPPQVPTTLDVGGYLLTFFQPVLI